jgi:hypothetical protein
MRYGCLIYLAVTVSYWCCNHQPFLCLNISLYEQEHPGWDEFIEQAFHANEAYFRRKWGCVDRKISFENCTFTSPFNNNNVAAATPPLKVVDSFLRADDLKTWSLNESRVRNLKLLLSTAEKNEVK